MRLALLLAALACVGCGRQDVATPSAQSDSLAAKVARYEALVATQQDASGFVYTDECDSLLFSGLLGAAGVPVTLTKAEHIQGYWLRRPADYPECFATGASGSTISRDMLLGVMWWAWRVRRADVLQRLWDYGEKHSWRMGDGDPARTVMLSQVPLLARLLHALAGKDYAVRHTPTVYPPGLTGYEAHLQALTAQLEFEVGGRYLHELAVRRMTEHAERQPQNPLFAAVLCQMGSDSECQRAETILMTAPQWPDDRLPTSADVCDRYVVQRDAGADWEPCPEQGRTHAGVDFLFTAHLLK